MYREANVIPINQNMTPSTIIADEVNCLERLEKQKNRKKQKKTLSEIKIKSDILKSLTGQIKPVDFAEMLYPNLPEDERNKKSVSKAEMKVYVIREILKTAEANNWQLCKQSGFCYLYNGEFWETIEEDQLKRFLSDCAKAMGVKMTIAEDSDYADKLLDQFLFSAHLDPPEYSNEKVLINLKNGTFHITQQEQELKDFAPSDFIRFQLPFGYDPEAKCPIFDAYLDRVLPDKTAQALLAEYAGYLFIRHGNGLKLEQVLILHGGGENGKSVFFEVITAMLGSENVSNYSLMELTDPKSGYYRAEIANKLLNYATEISREINSDLFKKLASGEPISARSPYGKPFDLRHYAKLIFNANNLPKNVELTKAFFRRFCIIPFSVTIPEEEQDKELHKKITDSELAGVFLWTLNGLKRLLANKKFSECRAAKEALEQYSRESDSVQMFLEDNDYQKSVHASKQLQELYSEYKSYCRDVGSRECGRNEFTKRLKHKGYEVIKGEGLYPREEKSRASAPRVVFL